MTMNTESSARHIPATVAHLSPADQERARQEIMAAPLKLRDNMKATWQNLGRDGVPFDDAAHVLAMAHERDGGKIDDIDVADLRSWIIVPDAQGDTMSVTLDGKTRYTMRKNGLQGILERIQAGAGVYKLLSDGLPPKMQILTTNTMLARSPVAVPCTFRVRRDEIAAVVSQKYAAVDTLEMIDISRKALEEQGLLREARVTDVIAGGRDGMRIVLPSREGEMRKGDIVRQGFDFRNGSFGGAAVSVHSTLYRLVCLNGMTAKENGSGWRYNHTGDVARLQGKINAAIPQALAEASRSAERFQAMVGLMLDDVFSLFGSGPSSFVQKYDLTQTEAQLIQADLVSEVGPLGPKQQLPAYEVINAITHAAQQFAPERRMDLETVAGRYMAELFLG